MFYRSRSIAFSPLSFRFSALLLLLVFTFAAASSLSAALSPEINELLNAYFHARYGALEELRYPQAWDDCLSSAARASERSFGEDLRLQAQIAYRSAWSAAPVSSTSKRDQRLGEDWQIELDVLHCAEKQTQALVLLREEYRYAFRGSPSDVIQGSRQHRILLCQENGAWRILSDEYLPEESALRSLETRFGDPGMTRERYLLLAELLGAIEGRGSSWQHHAAASLSAYAEDIVFAEDQDCLFVNGRLQSWVGTDDVLLNWIDGSPFDVQQEFALTPKRLGGQLYLPVRALLEKVGGEVLWNEATGQTELRFGANQLSYSNASDLLLFNGEAMTLGRIVPLLSDRAYLPASLLARLIDRSYADDIWGNAVMSASPRDADSFAVQLALIDRLFLGRFDLADTLSVVASEGANRELQAAFAELFGLEAAEFSRLHPELRADEALVQLQQWQAPLLLLSREEASALAKPISLSAIVLEQHPVGSDLVALRRSTETESPPTTVADRLLRWLQAFCASSPSPSSASSQRS